MGQAKRRGTFEQRRQEAILREKERLEAKRLYDIEHPRKLSKGTKALLPLYSALLGMDDYMKPFGR